VTYATWQLMHRPSSGSLAVSPRAFSRPGTATRPPTGKMKTFHLTDPVIEKCHRSTMEANVPHRRRLATPLSSWRREASSPRETEVVECGVSADLQRVLELLQLHQEQLLRDERADKTSIHEEGAENSRDSRDVPEDAKTPLEGEVLLSRGTAGSVKGASDREGGAVNTSAFKLPHRPTTASSSSMRRMDGKCCGASLSVDGAAPGLEAEAAARSRTARSPKKEARCITNAFIDLRERDALRETTEAKNAYLSKLNAVITLNTGFVETRRVTMVTMPMFQALHPMDYIADADISSLPTELRATSESEASKPSCEQARSPKDDVLAPSLRSMQASPPRAPGKERRKVLIPPRLNNLCPVVDEITCSCDALDEELRRNRIAA
jgi:hypothetical protein